MDPTRFDRLAVAIGQRIPRRSALSLLATLGITGLRSQGAGAQLGGLVNGQPCTSGDQCASGFCKRKKGTKKFFCRAAPGQGICSTEFNACEAAGELVCGTDSSGGDCLCFVTSRGYSFCGVEDVCFACQTDRDCEKRPGVGKRGDRCVVCLTCTGNSFGRACVHACPNRASVEGAEGGRASQIPTSVPSGEG
jgi:hypothetical protein